MACPLTRRISSVAAVILLINAARVHSSHSQDAPPPPPTFRMGVDAVRIDAVVTDKHGHVVTDLAPDDFELRQDGQLQAVTLAQYVGELTSGPTSSEALGPPSLNPAVEGRPPRAVAADHVRRTIALVVDDLGSSWSSIRDTRKAMHTFIDERVQPGDLVGILRTSTFSGALQQFTTDKRRLHEVVDQVRWTAQSRRGVEPFTAGSTSHGNSHGAAEMDALIANTAGTPGAAEVNSALITLSALTMIVRGARELPGRKAVIVLSEGYRLDTEGGFTDTRITQTLDRLYDQAARAGVVIYTVDVRGLQTGCEIAEGGGGGGCANIRTLLTTENSLWAIAHETGGQAIENTNDLAAGLARVDEAERGYYVLGYTPAANTFAEPGKTASFHKLSLRVKKPGLEVRVRSGFLGHADEPESRVKTPAERMLLAVTSPFVSTTIPLRVSVLPAFTVADGNYIRALLHVDVDTLTPIQDNGRNVLQAEILALALDEWGNEVARRGNTMTVVPDPTRLAMPPHGAVLYSIKLPIARSGGYHVRIAIRDTATGHLGTAGQFVEVQDAERGDFALSGLLLTTEPVQPESAGTGARDGTPTAASADPTRTVFAAGDRLIYTYEVYNARGTVQAAPSVWHDGTKIFSAAPDSIVAGSKADRTLKVAGGIRLTHSMTPGDYVFQIAVTATAEKQRSKRLIREVAFQVQ